MSETTVTQQASNAAKQEVMTPAVDVIEDATGITLYADLPGVPRDKLNINVEADALTIEGELALTVPEGMAAIHAEIGRSHFRRVFTLSKELDAEKVRAEYKHGVLTLHIPKAAHAQPKRINVAVH
ncbi:MAG: Hsp20/alpha crystallin family protein [Steroidobacteraceae bacterium]